MINSSDIQSKLRKFNLLGYADVTVMYDNNLKGGKILNYTDTEWKYEDEFYGGEPYSGNETLWFKDQAIFRCVYWGKVIEGVSFHDVYEFLRRALKQGVTGACVHRGPETFVEEDLTYTNKCIGSIEEFVQIERIFKKGGEIYTAHFIGGIINTRK